MIADGSAQHRIAGLKRIEDRALRNLALDFEIDFAVDVRQSSQMLPVI